MDYLWQNFGDRIALVVLVLLATAVVAVVATRRPRSGGLSDRMARVARACSVGFVLAAIVASTEGLGSGEGFIWGIGDGGLSTWSTDLARFPRTIQSVLLVGNVAIYVPVGLFASVGWPLHEARSLLVALAVPAAVEGLQVFVLQGVGSTDDYILNALGIVLGWLVGVAARWIIPRGSRPIS